MIVFLIIFYINSQFCYFTFSVEASTQFTPNMKDVPDDIVIFHKLLVFESLFYIHVCNLAREAAQYVVTVGSALLQCLH